MDIEFEQAPGVGDGQGNLACCSPWGLKELDTTERLAFKLFCHFLTIQYLKVFKSHLLLFPTHPTLLFSFLSSFSNASDEGVFSGFTSKLES